MLLHSPHGPGHENSTPCLKDAEAAVVSEPRARSDRGEPRPAHRPAVRERRAVDCAVTSSIHHHHLRTVTLDQSLYYNCNVRSKHALVQDVTLLASQQMSSYISQSTSEANLDQVE